MISTSPSVEITVLITKYLSVIKTITSTYHELLKTALNIDDTYLFYRDFLDRKFYIVVIYTSVRLLGVSKTIVEIVIDNIKLIITFGSNFKEIEQLFKKCRLNYSFRTDFSNTLRACFVCHEFGFLKIHDSLFISLIIYGCLYNILALLDLTTYIKNFRYVIANITENMLVLMTVIKISVLRIKCSSLSRFLIETKADNTADNYKHDEERLICRTNKAVSEAVQYKKLCIRLYTRIFTYNNDHFRLLGNSLLLRFYQFSSYRSIDHIEVQSQECFQYYRRSSPRNPKNNSRTSSIDKKNLLIEIFVFNFERYKCVERYEISEADEKDVIIKNNLSSSHLLADLFEDSFNIVIGQHLFRTTILLCIPRYRMLSS
ncbi:LOW QUALITY PROTEIN: odorant receptor 13a-like isoform X2 [Vespula squamosa]|uniref:Odorant receptor 13a-like isoform X2 n=1 Tax=Vespula squamosa TaxID=30214 RepID=A0ABD2BAK8_VESSQ